MTDLQIKIHEDIQIERLRQDDHWGADRCLSFGDWYLILGEETGEVAEAMLECQYGNKTLADIRKELIQVAAVAVAIIEDLDQRITE